MMHTPCYQYDLGILENTLKSINASVAGNADWHVHYAIKANANPLLLKLIKEYGLGIVLYSPSIFHSPPQ